MTSIKTAAHISRSNAIAILTFVMIIWGMQPLAIKYVVSFYSPLYTAFMRSLIAAAIFSTLALFIKIPVRSSENAASLEQDTPRRSHLVWIAAGGIGLGLSNICWNASLLYTTVGASSLLQLFNIIIIALYGIIFLAEASNSTRIIGLLVALFGMFFIVWNGQDLSVLIHSKYMKGNILALLAGIGWGICAIAQKATIGSRPSIKVVAPMFTIAALLLGIMIISNRNSLPASFHLLAFLGIVLTGIIGLGLGNMLFAKAIQVIPASVGAALLTVCPLVSMSAAAIILHEPLTAYLLVGAPLTCLGVAISVLSDTLLGRINLSHRSQQ